MVHGLPFMARALFCRVDSTLHLLRWTGLRLYGCGEKRARGISKKSSVDKVNAFGRCLTVQIADGRTWPVRESKLPRHRARGSAALLLTAVDCQVPTSCPTARVLGTRTPPTPAPNVRGGSGTSFSSRPAVNLPAGRLSVFQHHGALPHGTRAADFQTAMPLAACSLENHS